MIDTEALRKKIIDLAIRGKLTEQLPSDGDAEDLYVKIQEEKARLINEGRVKNEKPLPEIDAKEIPFDIPKNWKWVRWGNLSEKIQYGYNAPAKTVGKIKMVRISDIQDGKVLWDTVPYCDIKESELKDYLLRENDILFARTGGTVGKSYIVSFVPEDAVYAGYLIRTSYSSDICASFIKYFMESGLYWKQLRDGTIATAQPNCNGKTLSKMIVPFPPYAEQKRISEIITATFSQIDIIDTLQQQYESNVSVLKDKIIDAGIRGKLTEQLQKDGDAETLYSQIQEEKKKLIKEGKIKKEKPLPEINDEEIAFEIPKNWKWVRLSDISDTNIGLTYHPENVVEQGTVVLRSNNIQDGKFDYTDLIRVNCVIRDTQRIRENDILICSRNGSKKLVGKCAIYDGKLGNVSFGAFMAVLRTPFYKYVYYYLTTNVFRRYFSNDDTKQINQVTQDILKKAVVPLPPISEQNRITKTINAMFSLLA